MVNDIHVLLYQKNQGKENLLFDILSQEKGIMVHRITVLSSLNRYQKLYSSLCVIYDGEILTSWDIIEINKIKNAELPVLVLIRQVNKTVYAHELQDLQVIYKPEHVTVSFIRSLIVKIKFLSMPAKQNVLEDLHSTHIIVIGASTGGPRAIETILKVFRAQSYGIIIVQHMNDENLQGFADYLNKQCSSHVVGARENELVKNGIVYIAKEKRHLTIQRQKDGFHLHYTNSQKINCVCPSIDVLFESVAKEAGCLACGVLLTGMGEDGAAGLKAMKDKGAFTIIQDKDSCDVYGMPKVAKAIQAHCIELPLQQIGSFLNGLDGRFKRKNKEIANERENYGRR